MLSGCFVCGLTGTGVAGRLGTFVVEGKGSEAELSLASNDFISRADARSEERFVSACPLDLGLEPCWELGRELRLRPSVGSATSWDALLGVSLTRLDRELEAVTVCALVGLGCSLSFVSSSSSPVVSTGFGLRACATARGPAHCGIIGKATLARTKLDRTVTGNTFSLILSCRAESAKPKTMCWTLL